MSTITIGIDASRANREQKTGVEWYTFHLLQQMKEISRNKKQVPNSDKIRFVLYSDESLKGELAELPENWESRVLKWPPKRFWTQLRLSWEMLVRPPDILFIPAHVFPIIHPKKTVMTVHDIAATRFPESYNWFERWYSIWSAKYAVKNLWKVIVPSQFVKNELKSVISNRKSDVLGKILIIHHGYDKQFRPIQDQVIIEKVLSKYSIHQPLILSVGRWETKKNTARIMQAFDCLHNISDYRLPITDYQLVLIGKPGHGYEKVAQAYQQSPYKDRILMPGYVDPADLVYIMNAAEVFVFPSLYEGFGLPVLEAMACGTPVVAGKGSSLEEVGGDACVYVDPMSVKDIARGIVDVLGEKEKRKREKGLERVKQFSWEKCARETLQILEE